MKIFAEFDGCVDCVDFVANGTIPEDRPDLPELIAAGWPTGHIVNADKEGDEPHFSWSPCGCCGSRLGGNRMKLAILVEG